MLAAWTASPARFREDANAEEELALGAYRDRVVVELAQNAADAALRAGVPGRLRFTLIEGVLVAANAGAPLDAAGVESLSTLRASAKRDSGATGRFGVGFAAVRSVCDEPLVASTSGAVRWSLTGALERIGAVPALAPELARRGAAVPVLRLPGTAAARPPAGFDTAVVLPLRDDAAVAAVRQELADVDPTLLLTLPALAEVQIDSRRLAARRVGADVVIDDDGERTRWRVVRRSGRLATELVTDRPVEERAGRSWSVTCAVPLGAADAPVPLPSSVPAVLRAPTSTDDPLSLPVVLVASWPVDSGRRRIAPGPLRTALVGEAATAYADLVRDVAVTPAVLDLVPAGLAAGEVDGALRAAVLERLVETPFLPLAQDRTLAVRPRDAVAVDLGEAVVDVLAPALPDLLPADWAARVGPLAVLGVRRLGAAEVVDALAGLERPPPWWRLLYAALGLSHLGGPERDALGALPVPLTDGRRVTGPRGLLLPTPEIDAGLAVALGLRVVHPDAVHPLLTLLGAVETTPRSLLADPRLSAAVAASYDAEDPAPVAEAVLRLVAAAGIVPGERPELADLALRGADGEFYPAGELLLPSSDFAAVMSAEAPFGTVDAALVERWGAEVITAVGVLDRFALLRDADVPVDPAGAGHDLDGEAAWLAGILDGLPAQDVPPLLGELLAVRDLEYVEDWDRALPLLPAAALSEPAFVVLADGRRVEVTPYTRWWLADAPVLSGRTPRDLTLAGSDLAGLYDPAPADLDAALLGRLGVRTGLDALLAEPDGAAEVLDRLASDRPVDRDVVRRLHGSLSAYDVPPPARVRALRDGRAVPVDPAGAVVVDAPDLLPLVASRAVVPAPLTLAADVADLLDVPLASELGAYGVRSIGVERRTPYGDVVEHAELTVADASDHSVRVGWRVVAGVAHVDAAAGPDGIGRAIAWRDGRWSDRWLLAGLLRAPELADAYLAERDLDP